MYSVFSINGFRADILLSTGKPCPVGFPADIWSIAYKANATNLRQFQGNWIAERSYYEYQVFILPASGKPFLVGDITPDYATQKPRNEPPYWRMIRAANAHDAAQIFVSEDAQASNHMIAVQATSEPAAPIAGDIIWRGSDRETVIRVESGFVSSRYVVQSPFDDYECFFYSTNVTLQWCGPNEWRMLDRW